MTHEELVRADFNAKAGVIEAERSVIRSQITLLEAQLKQNEVKMQDLELSWKNYQEGLKQSEQQRANLADQQDEPEPIKPKKAASAKA